MIYSVVYALAASGSVCMWGTSRQRAAQQLQTLLNGTEQLDGVGSGKRSSNDYASVSALVLGNVFAGGNYDGG